MGFFGAFPVISILVLLMLSFFVLLAIPKAETKKLKQFGRVIVIISWITALYLIAISIYANYTNSVMSKPSEINRCKFVRFVVLYFQQFAVPNYVLKTIRKGQLNGKFYRDSPREIRNSQNQKGC